MSRRRWCPRSTFAGCLAQKIDTFSAGAREERPKRPKTCLIMPCCFLSPRKKSIVGRRCNTHRAESAENTIMITMQTPTNKSFLMSVFSFDDILENYTTKIETGQEQACGTYLSALRAKLRRQKKKNQNQVKAGECCVSTAGCAESKQ